MHHEPRLRSPALITCTLMRAMDVNRSHVSLFYNGNLPFAQPLMSKSDIQNAVHDDIETSEHFRLSAPWLFELSMKGTDGRIKI